LSENNIKQRPVVRRIKKELSTLSGNNYVYNFICPKCAGDANLFELDFVCEDCNNIYSLNACNMPDVQTSKRLDTKALLSKIVCYDVDKEKGKDISVVEHPNMISMDYSGEVCEFILRFKEKFSITSVEDVMRIIFQGFIVMLETIENAPGAEVYLIDSGGNRSPNLKSLVLFKKKLELMKQKEQQKVTAKEFLFRIEKLMGVWRRNYNEEVEQ